MNIWQKYFKNLIATFEIIINIVKKYDLKIIQGESNHLFNTDFTESHNTSASFPILLQEYKLVL